MKTFGGSVLFLDRSDINTDEIIEAKYLEELPKQELETYLFQNLKIEGFNPATDGINTVVAPTFAKSFRQNMFENGLMAIEIDKKSIADMFRTFADKETECKIVLNDDGTAKVKLIAGSLSKSYQFNVDEAEKALFNK